MVKFSFRAHLANHDELISKSFQGSHGKAYLFNSVVNVKCGRVRFINIYKTILSVPSQSREGGVTKNKKTLKKGA